MSRITEYLQNILSAVYGRDVRQSIHDAIQQCYADATGNPESVAGVIDDLNDAKEEINTQLGTIDSRIKERDYDSFVAQRKFRLVRTYAGNCCQSFCYIGTNFVFGGNGNGINTVQNLVETDLNGTIIREKTFTDEHVGHMNGMAYLDGIIYTANGWGGEGGLDDYRYISEINYSDFSVIKSIHFDNYNPVSIAAYEGEIYINAFVGSSYSWHVILKYNRTNTSVSEVCRFQTPSVLSAASSYAQGFCIHDGIAYLVRSSNNMILKVRLSDGTILGTIALPIGDGQFPYGESEDMEVVDGQVYITSLLYAAGGHNPHRFIQVFKTNIGGEAMFHGNEFANYNNWNTLYVNYDGTSKNPTGLTVADGLYNLEEASLIYDYYHSKGGFTFSAITVSGTNSEAVGDSGYNDVAVFNRGGLYFDLTAATSSTIDLRVYNGNYYIYGGTFKRLQAQSCQLTTWEASVPGVTDIDGSHCMFAKSTIAGLDASASVMEQAGSTITVAANGWRSCVSSTISH